MAGTLSPVHYVSRTSHRSFELPENQLLSWLVDDLGRTVALIEHRVSTPSLHAGLQSLRDDCEKARQHHWFSDISVPLRLTPEMILAASRHRRPEYRAAAALARRRYEMETSDNQARWFSVLSLLAVNWLEPVSDDDLFELYVLILALDLLSDELGFGEPVEYGLVTSRRGHIAMFQSEHQAVRVYFDQTPATVLGISTEYGQVFAQHRGMSGGERRPDILVVAERGSETRLVLIEVKKTQDGRCGTLATASTRCSAIYTILRASGRQGARSRLFSLCPAASRQPRPPRQIAASLLSLEMIAPECLKHCVLL